MEFTTIYESLIQEARGEFLWNYFNGEMGKVKKDLGEDNFSIFIKLISIDPTTDVNSLDNVSDENELSKVRIGGYSQWIINKFLKNLKVKGGDIRVIKNYYEEDAYKIRAGLDGFIKNHNNIWVSGGKDLNKYDLDFIINLGIDYLSNDTTDDEKEKTSEDDYTIIIDNADIRFCRILTFKGSKELGTNTNYCTAAQYEYFDQYNDSPLYIVINKGEYADFKELRKTSNNYSSIAKKYPTRKIQFTASAGGHMMSAPDEVVSVETVKDSIGGDNWKLIYDWLVKNDVNASYVWNGESEINELKRMVKQAEDYNAANPCKNVKIYYDINDDGDYPAILSVGTIKCNYFNDRFIDFSEITGPRWNKFKNDIEGIYRQHGGFDISIEPEIDYKIRIEDMPMVYANSGETLFNDDDLQRSYDRISERIKNLLSNYTDFMTDEGIGYWENFDEDFEWDYDGNVELSSVSVNTLMVKDEKVVGIYSKLLLRMLTKNAMKILRKYLNSSFNSNQMMFTEFGYAEYEEDPRDAFSLRVKCEFNLQQTSFYINITASPKKDADGYVESYAFESIKNLNKKIKSSMGEEMLDYYINLVEKVISHGTRKKRIHDISLNNLI